MNSDGTVAKGAVSNGTVSKDTQRTTPAAGGAATADRRTVAVLGAPGEPPRLHDSDAPLLVADDLGVVRGDGCFETLLAVDGRPARRDAHLERLRASARMLDIDAPADADWDAAMELAVTARGRAGESMVRLVLTRGPEHGGVPTAYVTVVGVPAASLRARDEGVRVCTLARGFSVDLAATAPWQLLGAKTLSYATNMAALRHARATGYDDALFVSAEGDVLEGPRSTLVVARDGVLASPPAGIGVLAGTTLGGLAEEAAAEGIRVEARRMTVADVLVADGAWLISSIIGAARITALDSDRLPVHDTGVGVEGLVARAVGRTPAAG